MWLKIKDIYELDWRSQNSVQGFLEAFFGGGGLPVNKLATPPKILSSFYADNDLQ